MIQLSYSEPARTQDAPAGTGATGSLCWPGNFKLELRRVDPQAAQGRAPGQGTCSGFTTTTRTRNFKSTGVTRRTRMSARVTGRAGNSSSSCGLACLTQSWCLTQAGRLFLTAVVVVLLGLVATTRAQCPSGQYRSCYYCGCGDYTCTCYRCPAGRYGNGGSTCGYCSPGQYSGAGAAACTTCSAGLFGSTSGLTTSSCSGPCRAGFYCPAGSTSPTAVACVAGQYSLAGAASCSNCAAGTR